MAARIFCWMSVLLPVLAGATFGHAQSQDGGNLDSLLTSHSHPMTLDGTPASGPGFDLLLESASRAQFFVIAEEHNLLELNELAIHLFDELQARYDFQHLVLEQGNVITSWLDAAAGSGGLDAVNALVRRYPHAPTFATDEEFELMTHVRSKSRAEGAAVWGVDQELAAMHLLEHLAEHASSPEARSELQRLADEARPYEEVRTGDVHYLTTVANPEDYLGLSELPGMQEDGELRVVFDALQRTVRIYTGRRSADGVYASGFEREQSMRARFMEHYRVAQTTTALPKAIVKMGHWHTLPGFYRANVLTFGNFLAELAAANGADMVMVATYVVNSPDSWRNSGGVIERISDPNGIKVVDLRPLRPLAHRDAIAELSDAWHDLIFQADFLLIIGGGRTGSYDTAYGSR